MNLVFDEMLHKYVCDGVELPSVTTILKRVLGNNSNYAKQWHMDRGTEAHYLYELLAKGEDLKDYFYDDRLTGNVEAWLDWQAREKPEFEAVELRLADKKNGFAGTIDAVALINGKRWIIDYKASSTMRDQLQLAAYKVLYEANNPGLKVDKLVSLQIRDDGWKYSSPLQKLQLSAACSKWQSVLTVYRLLEAGF